MTILRAQWSAPATVQAISTTRLGGVSQGAYADWNLAAHVGDDPTHVAENRRILRDKVQLPSEPIWLEQTHTTRCVDVDRPFHPNADAAITRQPNRVLAIMTADCLPIVLCNQQGDEIAAIHAGWRGLAEGIIENTLSMMQSPPAQCMAWIGPAICGHCYATGAEVVAQFLGRYPYGGAAFTQRKTQWYADLPGLAKAILAHLGLGTVSLSNKCTFEANSQYYSYRRAAQTGRITTLIWFKESS